MICFEGALGQAAARSLTLLASPLAPGVASELKIQATCNFMPDQWLQKHRSTVTGESWTGSTIPDTTIGHGVIIGGTIPYHTIHWPAWVAPARLFGAPCDEKKKLIHGKRPTALQCRSQCRKDCCFFSPANTPVAIREARQKQEPWHSA